MKITEYDAGPVTDADVAVAQSLRHLVRFPNGVTSLDLPATFGRQHVYVRVTINGRGLDYVLDTGASGISIDMQVARELGLPLHALAIGRHGAALHDRAHAHPGDAHR